jgi:hypothetical protein
VTSDWSFRMNSNVTDGRSMTGQTHGGQQSTRTTTRTSPCIITVTTTPGRPTGCYVSRQNGETMPTGHSMRRQRGFTMTRSTSNRPCCKGGTNSVSLVASSKSRRNSLEVPASVVSGRHVSLYPPPPLPFIYMQCLYGTASHGLGLYYSTASNDLVFCVHPISKLRQTHPSKISSYSPFFLVSL